MEVWATDQWTSVTEKLQRIQDAGMAESVYPLPAHARYLPFAADFFDAIVSIDAYPYFGTDDLYLNYLADFVKPDGLIAIVGAGLTQEVDSAVPEHLRRF